MALTRDLGRGRSAGERSSGPEAGSPERAAAGAAELRLDPEWLRWVVAQVPRPEPSLHGLGLLARALLDPTSGLGIRPGERTTLPDRTLADRETDCVGFAWVAALLGRRLGLGLGFAAPIDPERVDRAGDLRVTVRHLAVRLKAGESWWILDLDGLRAEPAKGWRAVSDAEAAAILWSNLGAGALLDGEPQRALPALDRALEADPTFAPAWVHLGVARRRAGDPSGAERAYRTAAELDPEAADAWRNLALLLASERDALRAAVTDVGGGEGSGAWRP